MPTFKAHLLAPIVYLSDIEWVLNQKANASENKKKFYYEFEKKDISDLTPWKAEIWVNDDGKMIAFQLPARLKQILGEEVIMNAIRAIGRAEVSIHKKTAYLEMRDQIKIEQVLALMGKAVRKEIGFLHFNFKNGSSFFNVDVKGEKYIEWVKMRASDYSIEVEFKRS